MDLPGYGYAKVSKETRKKFQKFIRDYFLKRQQLSCSFVLIDARHEPQKIDLEFMQFLGESQIPFCIVFTKSDKLKMNQLQTNINKYTQEMLKFWEEMPRYFISSATTKVGRDEILGFIDAVNHDLKNQ